MPAFLGLNFLHEPVNAVRCHRNLGQIMTFLERAPNPRLGARSRAHHAVQGEVRVTRLAAMRWQAS